MQISELLDFTTFANYGQDVNKEIEAEIFLNLLSDLGATFYNRDMGTDAKKSLSRVINFSQELKLQNQVIESMQNYNNTVDDSTERRIAVPADTVVIRASDSARGNADIEMLYYRLRDLAVLPVRV